MDSKEDEEISIDFSKIRNFFKSDKKEDKEEKKAEESAVPAKKEDEDMEISFDLSKVKKFFKSDGHEKEKSATDEEISINWAKVADFFKKYGVVFIALIPIILSIYIRMQAGFLPFTDDWAANSVINGVKSQIRASIDQQYPNLPDANKNALVDTELQKVINQNPKQFGDTIKAYSASFKSFFQDENGKNYMPDIDPYYWFRYVKNIVDHGHPGDVLKDGKPYDTHQLAPLGRPVFPDMFHEYFLAYFYRFLHIFAPDLSIMRSMFYYPVFVSALCVLLVFLIARKIAGNLGGFFAGLMMAVNSAFLGRTLFGHADSDAWVVFFPLLVTWLFVAAIDAKSVVKVIIFNILAGLFTAIYTYAWSGWWYIFDFLIATISFTFLYLVLTNLSHIKRDIKSVFSNITLRNLIFAGFVYFLSTALFVTIFSGWGTFVGSFLGPLSFKSIKAPVDSSMWPNVLTTVAELNEGSINGIISSVGSQFLFYLSLLGLVLAISRSEELKKFDFAYVIFTAIFYGAYFLLQRAGLDISPFGLLIWIALPILIRIGLAIFKKDSSYDFKPSILLAMWIISTIYASIKGIRFTLLLAPAFSVAFGVALGRLYIYLLNGLTKELKIHKAVGSSILIVLLLLVCISPIRGAIITAGADIPIVNDAWYNAMNAIKQDSKEDAIITSWWDFGHHFKALADRKVTFDGTTQTHPPAHWVGKLLMSKDEQEAAGILRMLDCGSNNAHSFINNILNDSHKSLKILNEIMPLSRKDAEKRLRDYKFNDKQIEHILSATHCNPPEAYFIASNDMIGKSGVWSHFGSWNFEKADIWYNARNMPQAKAVEYMTGKFNYTKERAENTYFEMQSITSDRAANDWIAPWPGYGGMTACTKNKNEVYACSNGFQINLSGKDVFAIGQQGIVRPKLAAFTTDNGLLFREYNGTTIDLGMTIIPKNENELDAVLSSKELAGSMFTRMFYMQGHGLRYFKLFNHQLIFPGSNIETNVYTYKMDWEGKNATIVQDYVNKPIKNNVSEKGMANKTVLATENDTNIDNTAKTSANAS